LDIFKIAPSLAENDYVTLKD